MNEPFTQCVHPDFHPMLKFPAVDFEKRALVKFLRFYARLNSVFTRKPVWVLSEKFCIHGDHKPVNITYFKNKLLSGERPVIIFFHGGGFVMPAFGFHKALLFEYMQGADCDAIFVDYALTPEHKASDILPQCFGVFEWLRANTTQWKVAPQKIAVVGDSAGAAIAASVAQMAFDRYGEGALACQMLIYPVTDDRLTSASIKEFYDCPCWSGKASKQMWEAYDAPSCSYSVPIKRKNLQGITPAYIETAEIDPLHDEGLAYAEQLMASDVKVELNETKGTVHGFDSTLTSSITIESVKQRCQFLKVNFS